MWCSRSIWHRSPAQPVSAAATRPEQLRVDRATWLDLSQGTGGQQNGKNTLDIAISATRFRRGRTPRGERYTANGAMQVNAAGPARHIEGCR